MTELAMVYRARKAAGLCIRCCAPLPEGKQGSECEFCRTKARHNQRMERQKWKEEHRCVKCSRLIPEDDKHVTCETCRAKAREWARLASERKLAAKEN